MSRFAVSVEVANLTRIEKGALDSLIAILTDPQLYMLRQEFLHGDICLVVEDSEITWADSPAKQLAKEAA